MKVLAADPGYDRLGLAVLEKTGGREVLVHSECFTTDKTASLSLRLASLGARIESLLKEHKPDLVAAETLYFNKNQKTAMAVAEARGVLVYLAETHNARVCEYTPQQIKVATTGHGGSSKDQVAAMLPRLISGIPEGALDDEYDAIAVGITCLASER